MVLLTRVCRARGLSLRRRASLRWCLSLLLLLLLLRLARSLWLLLSRLLLWRSRCLLLLLP
ncbi:MAG: hypothetical protein ABJD53_12075, partial [Gammaproteobacteria bacterium]